MRRRLLPVVLAVLLVGVLALNLPSLHPKRRIRALVDEVTEHVDVPGVRDCRGVLTHHRECRGD